jgi:hypothetical protein
MSAGALSSCSVLDHAFGQSDPYTLGVEVAREPDPAPEPAAA